MDKFEAMKNSEILSSPGYMIFFGIFFLILIVVGQLNKSGGRGTGRFASTREILQHMGNWARFPLAPVMFVFVLLGVSLPFFGLVYYVDVQMFLNIPNQWPNYLGVLLIVSVIVFWIIYEIKLIPADKNRLPLGEKLGSFSIDLSLSEKARFEHVRLMGRAGTGKTSSFMFPQLLEDATGNCSSIFLDVKSPEAYQSIAGAWTAQGKKVILFDPFHKDCIGFDPLDSVDKRGLTEVVETVYGKLDTDENASSIWFEEQERRLFSLLCELVMGFKDPGQGSMPMVYELALRGIDAIQEVVTYCGNPNLQEQFSPYFKNHRLSDVLSGVLNRLDLFAQPEIAAAFSRADFDLDLLFREPVLLIIASPHSNPKARLGASILLRAIMQKVYANPVREAKDGVSVFFYLDEFYALHLPDMADFANTARSARVGIVTGLQTQEQLYRYKRHEVGSITINTKIEIYLQGCDPKTCKELSDRLGKRMIKEKRRSRSMRHGATISVSQVETLLETPDSIENLPINQALIFMGGMRGLKIRQTPFYKVSKYKKQIGLPVKVHRPVSAPLKAPHFKDIEIPEFDQEESNPDSGVLSHVKKQDRVMGWED